MERFVIKQNIEHYRAMLKITTDLEHRAVFEKLLRKKKPSSGNTTTITKRNNACLHRVRSGGAHMTTGKAFGQLWSHGARDWASFVEPHYQSLYQAVHDRLGITEGTRVLDVGCGPGGAALLASGRGERGAGSGLGRIA